MESVKISMFAMFVTLLVLVPCDRYESSDRLEFGVMLILMTNPAIRHINPNPIDTKFVALNISL